MERKRIPYSEENTWFTITISNSIFGSYNFMDVYIYQKGPLSWAIKKGRRTKPKYSGRKPRSKTKPPSRNGTSSHPGPLKPLVGGSNVELLTNVFLKRISAVSALDKDYGSPSLKWLSHPIGMRTLSVHTSHTIIPVTRYRHWSVEGIIHRWFSNISRTQRPLK